MAYSGSMLEIRDLHATANGVSILHGLTLTVNAGEVHAIMGPNGSGKSTLAHVLAGRPGYVATSGTVRYKGKDLLDLSTEERACEGVFLAFQYPVEIPGINTTYFLKAAVNAMHRYRGEPELDAVQMKKLIDEKLRLLKIDSSLARRAINEGFSGGEKKRNEVFQMAVCDPTLCLMDETDSGLDIDALKDVAAGANTLRRPDRAIIVVTHYQRLLNYIKPDYVHVMLDGRIAKSGGPELAMELEEKGYDFIEREVAAAV